MVYIPGWISKAKEKTFSSGILRPRWASVAISSWSASSIIWQFLTSEKLTQKSSHRKTTGHRLQKKSLHWTTHRWEERRKQAAGGSGSFSLIALLDTSASQSRQPNYVLLQIRYHLQKEVKKQICAQCYLSPVGQNHPTLAWSYH